MQVAIKIRKNNCLDIFLTILFIFGFFVIDLIINNMLKNNDSYNYLKETENLLVTGPTGTNVMDIQILLVGVSD